MGAAREISRLAVGASPTRRPRRRPSGCAPTCRRTSTSTGCRSARAAARPSRYNFPRDGEYIDQRSMLLDLFAGRAGEGAAPARSQRRRPARAGLHARTEGRGQRDWSSVYDPRLSRSKRARTGQGRSANASTATFVKKTRRSPKRCASRSPGRTAKATSCSTSRTSARSRSAVRSTPERPADTPSRRRDLHLPAGQPGRGRPVRADRSLDAGPPRLSAAGHRRATCSAARRSTTRAARTAASTPASRRRCGACSSARRSSIASSAIRPASRRRGVSHQRSRAGLAPVVLPVEQHSGRELLDAGRAGQLQNPGVLERQVRRMLADPRAEALVEQLRGQWLQLRNASRARRPTM